MTKRKSAQAKKEIGQIQRELDKLHQREAELTALFKRFYEDNVLGCVPDEQYRILSAEYTQEQAQIKRNSLS